MRAREIAALLALGTCAAAVAWVAIARPFSEGSDEGGERVTVPEIVAPPVEAPPPPKEPPPTVAFRDSRVIGEPSAGRLVRGVMLPVEGPGYFTWDPIQRERENRAWRLWGADGTIRQVLRVVRGYRRAHPGAPRVGIGDISRPRGGDFGARYGLPGHSTHQNGLDVDVYYPRRDRREVAPLGASDIDGRLSQDLVDRFVAAGAEIVLVGPATGLTGPEGVVVPYVNHDNHLHVRFPPDVGAP